jgi:radical SAM protein with 4Fe4S-binding SPASM domain
MNKMKGSLRILRFLSFKRILNLFVLRSSFLLSRVVKKPIHLGLPWTLSIEPTTACNLGCPECPSGLKQFSRPTGKLSPEKHRLLLEKIPATVFYINYYFQGEPFLNPDFLTLISQAKQKRIFTSTSTNAHFIDGQKAREIVQSGLDQLIISIDGLTQKTYEAYRRNGQLNKVLEATEHLIAAKKELKSPTPYLIFQFLAVRANEHEIPEIHLLGKELNIDEVRIKTAQLYDYRHGNPLMPKNEKYARYKRNKDGSYSLKYKTGNYCWRMWGGFVLTWDERVVPCCFDKDAQHQLGKLTTESMKTIWKSEPYKRFRRQLFSDRKEIDICQNCSEGSKVWSN